MPDGPMKEAHIARAADLAAHSDRLMEIVIRHDKAIDVSEDAARAIQAVHDAQAALDQKPRGAVAAAEGRRAEMTQR